MRDFDAAISDDLSTPVALAVLEGLLKDRSISDSAKVVGLTLIDEVLGLKISSHQRKFFRRKPRFAYRERFLTHRWIEERVEQRRLAKIDRNFELADVIRSELEHFGVEVMDGDPLGWDWKLGSV